jgi:hypothetical protein
MERKMCELSELNRVIVTAKSNSYVAGAKPSASCRLGSHDVGYASEGWRYLDSYFGGSDFAGQEVVWVKDEPVWAMNYFGRILVPALINATKAGTVIKAALQYMYVEENRFLGGMDFDHALGRYHDRNVGDCGHFRGREIIVVAGREAYELNYHGGLIKS